VCEEAFCAEEEACAGAFVEGETQSAYQGIGGMIVFGGVVVDIAVAALGTEAVVACYGFEEGGFS
jgi:hypothetical protein